MVGTPLTEDLPAKTPNSEEEGEEEFLGETVEVPPPGHHIGLLCLDQGRGNTFLKSVLEGMGYVVDCAPSPDNALHRLRFNQYHIIVLDDAFGGQVPNPVASFLMNLNMSMRRDMFIILLGERFKTADQWQAFVESVDLVCHPADLRHLSAILKHALGEHERFYKVLNECLKEAGKKI
jgi:DNA-binding response OmpR family regulator